VSHSLALVGAQFDQAVERHRRRWHHLSRTASGGKETIPVSLFVILCPTVFSDLLVVLVDNFMFGRKRTFGGLKTYLRATDHTSSNIISRDELKIDDQLGLQVDYI
jgi:hypothetical protein